MHGDSILIVLILYQRWTDLDESQCVIDRHMA